MKLILSAPKFAATFRRRVLAFVLATVLPGLAWGSSVVGRVVNRSRNQPASGDDVILYKVDRSMHEVARTKSREDGTFHFESADLPYLVAVFHQNVSYHSKTLRGREPLEIDVYDSTPRLGGVQPESSTLFMERATGAVKITEFFVLSNQAQPPRTVAAGATFRFALPPGAVIDSAAVQPPGTLPVMVKASACAQTDNYCVGYPIRPGLTRLRVVFHLNQSETAWITLPPPTGMKNVAVMVPESFSLESRVPRALKRQGIEDGQAKYVAAGTLTARSLVFRLAENGPRAKSDRAPTAVTAPIDLSSYIASVAAWRTERNTPEPFGTGGRKLVMAVLVLLASMTMIAAAGKLSGSRARRRGTTS